MSMGITRVAEQYGHLAESQAHREMLAAHAEQAAAMVPRNAGVGITAGLNDPRRMARGHQAGYGAPGEERGLADPGPDRGHDLQSGRDDDWDDEPRHRHEDLGFSSDDVDRLKERW